MSTKLLLKLARNERKIGAAIAIGITVVMVGTLAIGVLML
jgi:hypothetical protein